MLCRDLLYARNAPEHRLCLDTASFYTLFNSPYTPHREGHAVDIYFPDSEALLPLEEARVMEIRRVEVPMYRSDAENHDYLLILKLDSMHVAKILHVEPRVEVGEKLVYGDPIGRIVISGYFYIWSEPHMHLEIRYIHDRYRARGGLRLAIAKHRAIPAQSITAIRGVVTEVCNHYILLKPYRASLEGPTPIALDAEGAVAYFEGGYPHYGYAAILTIRNTRRGRPVGIYDVYIVESCNSIDLEIRRLGFEGIATYMGREEVKLVFKDRARIGEIKEGDVLELGDLSGLIHA